MDASRRADDPASSQGRPPHARRLHDGNGMRRVRRRAGCPERRPVDHQPPDQRSGEAPRHAPLPTGEGRLPPDRQGTDRLRGLPAPRDRVGELPRHGGRATRRAGRRPLDRRDRQLGHRALLSAGRRAPGVQGQGQAGPHSLPHAGARRDRARRSGEQGQPGNRRLPPAPSGLVLRGAL